MIIYYGSIAYFLLIALALLLPLILFFFLRRKSRKISKRVILFLMALNLFQHLFKSYLYPQYRGMGFTALSTAYNVCAFLIIFSPLVFLLKINFLSDFFFFVGSVAGIIAIAVPYWHIGRPIYDEEVIRFFICHALLFASSVLPIALKIHKPSYKRFYLVGISFFSAIILIILNDVICLRLGIYPGVDLSDGVYVAMKKINPCWSFGPPDAFSSFLPIAKRISPDVFLIKNGAYSPTPVLWYIIPGYIVITVLSFFVFTSLDRTRLIRDFKYGKALRTKKNH